MTLATVLFVGGAVFLCFGIAIFDLVNSFCCGRRRQVVELPPDDSKGLSTTIGRILSADVQAKGQSSVLREQPSAIVIAKDTKDTTDVDKERNLDENESKIISVMEYRHQSLICKSDVINTVQGLRTTDVDKETEDNGETEDDSGGSARPLTAEREREEAGTEPAAERLRSMSLSLGSAGSCASEATRGAEDDDDRRDGVDWVDDDDDEDESKISNSLTLPQPVDDTDDEERKFRCQLCGNLQSSRLGVKPNGCAKKYNHLFHGIFFCSFGMTHVLLMQRFVWIAGSNTTRSVPAVSRRHIRALTVTLPCWPNAFHPAGSVIANSLQLLLRLDIGFSSAAILRSLIS